MINFGAKLKVDNSIYDKLTTIKAKTRVENTINEYKKFVEHPNFEAFTKEDTIELRGKNYARGYALEFEFKNPNLEEPYITGIYTNTKEPDIKPGELVFQTLLYLCFKTGEKPKFSDNSFSYINRVLFKNKLK